MASVFVVEVGSDYAVEGYYTTREMADEAAKRLGGEVCEHALDEMPELPDGKYTWFLEFDPAGSATEVHTIPPRYRNDKADNAYQTSAGGFRAWILHETEEGAIRTAREMIARGEFEKYVPPDMTNVMTFDMKSEYLLRDDLPSLAEVMLGLGRQAAERSK